jgi:hypothetical protein
MEVYLTILIFVIILAVVIHYYKVKKQKELQIKGVESLAHIKLLISLVQTHRGLSSAWLNGDKSKIAQLHAIKQQISTETDSLTMLASTYHSSRWTSFSEHWERLNRDDDDRDIDNNFTQHTQLIANLLYLLEDEAERSHLTAIFLPQLPHIGYVWRELAGATEVIGQSRAIGTGVATNQVCSSVHKIRLSFLQQNIQKTINEILAKLSSLNSFTYRHNELLKEAHSTMEFLNQAIAQEFIDSDKISINQDEYFSLATDSIKALDSVFYHQIEQVKHVV